MSLLTILGGAAALAVVVLILLAMQRGRIRSAAKRIHAHGSKVYGGAHQYIAVAASDFPHLDAAYYARMTRELEAAGFRMVGDMMDVTLEQAGGALMPVMARVLVGDGGTVLAAVYHARLKGSAATGEGNFHVVDIESVLDDGTFAMTSNAPTASALDSPPEVSTLFLPPGIGVAELLDEHRAHLAAWLVARPGVGPLLSESMRDVIGHQQRLDEIKAAFRRGERAIFSEVELRRLAQPDEAAQAGAVAVAREMDRMQRTS